MSRLRGDLRAQTSNLGPAVIFALLAIWAFAPLVSLVVYVGQHGGVLTGANGIDAFDQMAYLAWIRDEGGHLLASNLWVLGPTPHDYVHPMYVVSGLLWRIGLGVQLSYLIWKPVALLVMFFGFTAYVRHLLPGRRGQQAVALFLALFYASPVPAVANWTGHLSAIHRFQLTLATTDANSALNLWGFEHTAIAIGLMPVFLILAERLIARGEAARRTRRGWAVLAALAGLLVSWLHPWQGLMLLAIVAGLFAFKPPRRRYLALAIPAIATLLPLIYGFVLTRSDASWAAFEQQSTTSSGTAPVWALVASFGPLFLFAVLGLRRSYEDREWMLVLWLIACVFVYFLVPQFPPHALSGVTLPLAVLAVRGWERLRLRARASVGAAAPVAAVAVLCMTVPAAVYEAQGVGNDLAHTISGGLDRQLLMLSPDQAAAMRYLSRVKRPGGVLTPWYLSMSVPGFTGRPAYAGHPQWQPHANVAIDTAFFTPGVGAASGASRRAILLQTQARFVLADCGAPARLAADIAPLARPVGRFGCVTVYERN